MSKGGKALDRLRIARRGGRRLDLFYILDRARGTLSPADRVEWLEQLIFWVRGSASEKTNPETRIRFLFQRLNQSPEWKAASARQLRAIFREASALHLFTETGVPSSNVFVQEAVQRTIRIFLPPEEDPSSIASVVTRVFWSEQDPRWLMGLSAELRGEAHAWLRHGMAQDESIVPGLVDDATAACIVMSVRAAEIAVREDVVIRAPEYQPLQNPFLRLSACVGEVLTSVRSEPVSEEVLLRAETGLRNQLLECQRYLSCVRGHLERFGVSVELVFQLDRAKKYLDRLEEIGWFLVAQKRLPFQSATERSQWVMNAWGFFSKLVLGSLHERQLWRLIRDNLTLVARKTIERTGNVGEEYITRDAAEYRTMLFAAAGGGALTAFTAMVKYLEPPGMAPFFTALYLAFNYSGSFLLMHFLHLKLATKQPSMTAAALAGRLAADDGSQDQAGPGPAEETGFVDEVARISRSQFAAVVGNLAAVIPMALLLDVIGRWITGNHFLPAEKAESVLKSLDLLATLTMFYAALTGVLLWLSGFVSGWVENAYVYFRIPRVLSNHRFLKNLLGASRLEAWVDGMSRNIMGVVSAVSLGVALSFVPEIGAFFGLPLEVRHITLTAGSATFAIASLSPTAIGWAGWASLAAGVFVIGVMNFGVSFALALGVAARARNVDATRLRRLIFQVGRALLRSPSKFFVP